MLIFLPCKYMLRPPTHLLSCSTGVMHQARQKAEPGIHNSADLTLLVIGAGDAIGTGSEWSARSATPPRLEPVRIQYISM